MTVSEAARRLEISRSLCYKLCEEKRLPHVRIGAKGRKGAIRITEAGLKQFLESVKVEEGVR